MTFKADEVYNVCTLIHYIKKVYLLKRKAKNYSLENILCSEIIYYQAIPASSPVEKMNLWA